MSSKVFLDTNCIIDILEQRKYYYDYSKNLLQLSHYPWVYISAITVSNAQYITKFKDLEAYKKFLGKFRIVHFTTNIIKEAFNLNIGDFEDSVQIASALASECSYFVTWNKKHFQNIKGIEVLTPKEFLVEAK